MLDRAGFRSTRPWVLGLILLTALVLGGIPVAGFQTRTAYADSVFPARFDPVIEVFSVRSSGATPSASGADSADLGPPRSPLTWEPDAAGSLEPPEERTLAEIRRQCGLAGNAPLRVEAGSLLARTTFPPSPRVGGWRVTAEVPLTGDGPPTTLHIVIDGDGDLRFAYTEARDRWVRPAARKMFALHESDEGPWRFAPCDARELRSTLRQVLEAVKVGEYTAATAGQVIVRPAKASWRTWTEGSHSSRFVCGDGGGWVVEILGVKHRPRYGSYVTRVIRVFDDRNLNLFQQVSFWD